MEPRLPETLPRLVFPGLTGPGLFHGVFDRRGGTGGGRFSSLNVSYHVGDCREHVAANRQRLKQALGVERLVAARQIHGDAVLVLAAMPAADSEADGYDALITRLPGVALMIQQADCQAILLFDPVQRAVGIAHSGWRGTVANIIRRTIEAMSQNFSTRPADLKAAISPSLGPCCAEFVNHRTELPESFAAFQVRPAYFDFWAISQAQLAEAGVPAASIETAKVCTVCDRNYFSYRREGVTGRFASIIGLS